MHIATLLLVQSLAQGLQGPVLEFPEAGLDDPAAYRAMAQREARGLIPENSPEGEARAWEIGLTNMSRRHIGMLGIRFEDHDEFGPTGEPFQGTNILGKVVKGMENLKKFKQGETVYVRRR